MERQNLADAFAKNFTKAKFGKAERPNTWFGDPCSKDAETPIPAFFQDTAEEGFPFARDG